MFSVPNNSVPRDLDVPPGIADFRFLYFADLIRRPVCAGKINDRIGKLSDLVFALKEPCPEAIGIYQEFGWGKPIQYIPWAHVLRVIAGFALHLLRIDLIVLLVLLVYRFLQVFRGSRIVSAI